jgi:hypothetical protein
MGIYQRSELGRFISKSDYLEPKITKRVPERWELTTVLTSCSHGQASHLLQKTIHRGSQIIIQKKEKCY